MNIVEQIHSGIKTIAQATLGSDWVELKRVLKPEENDSRAVAKAFGIRHGAADTADGVTRVYTMDQRFEVVLARYAPPLSDDSQIQATFNDLFSKADDIFRALLLKKVGLPSIVLNVERPSLSQPDVLKNDAAVLVMGLIVKYRNSVTL